MKKPIDIIDYFGIQLHDTLEYTRYSMYVLFTYLGLSIDAVTALSWLMIIDTLLGLIKAIRIGQKISIKILLWGFVTKLLIILIPMIVATIAKGLNKDFNWALDFVIKILVINEGISNLTNIISIRTKRNIQNLDIVTLLVRYIRKLLLMFAKKMLGKSVEDVIKEMEENEKTN